MMGNVSDREASLFRKACEEESMEYGEGFGICNEKRLHRVLKKFTYECEVSSSAKPGDFDGYEIRIGKQIADLLLDRRVFEIQTGSVRPLAPKLKYYLEETEYDVVIICPVKARTYLLRVDRDSGEVLRKRYSSKKESVFEKLPDLVYIGEYLKSPRVSIRFLEIFSEEYRYSEKMRYRKKGSYDSELYPRELLSVSEYNFSKNSSELKRLGKLELDNFTASDYADISGFSGRKLYNTLNFFCSVGVLSKEKREGKFIYRKVK